MVRRSASTRRAPDAHLLVLIVDDNEDAREMYRMYFEHVGLRIITANDGRDAITKARRLKPDAIVMDLAMPVMDGWETARWLRDAPDLRHIPIVALTGRALRSPGDRERERDFDDYVTKPCLPDVLFTIVRNVVEQRGRRRRRA